MDIKGVGLDAAVARLQGQAGVAGKAQAGAPDFATVLSSALQHSDRAQAQADELARRFQAGDATVGLEQAMIAMQGANISFQAVVQVRNRLISAYHDVMNMQV